MLRDKIGIVVDGPGDLFSLKKRFNEKLKIIKTDGPRGHGAKCEDIVRHSKKDLNILKKLGCSKAIILLDLEERTISYEDFMDQLYDYLHEYNFDIEVRIVAANKMIENWYLADIEWLSKNKKFLKQNLKQKNFEGTHGKKEIKKLMKSGQRYNEISHGSQMFECIRFENACKNSKSFEIFLNDLNEFLK